jgi:hypothetical protein
MAGLGRCLADNLIRAMTGLQRVPAGAHKHPVGSGLYLTPCGRLPEYTS